MPIRKKASKKKFPHGPMRTCVICRTLAPKGNLLRISLDVNVSGHDHNGRGAYVCSEHDSGQVAKNKKKLARALRCDVQALHIHLKGESRS